MYKVFIKDKELILTSLTNFSNEEYQIIPFNDNGQLKTLINDYYNSNLSKKIIIYHHNLNLLFSELCKHFKIIHAAGGKVYNKNGDILFILRHGKWDLPKGKLESNENIEECAIREVQEECGVEKLNIEKKLIETYHVYELKNELVLKISHWYKMFCSDVNPNLTPQLEESITVVKFLNKEEQKEAIKNTYATIIDVLDAD